MYIKRTDLTMRSMVARPEPGHGCSNLSSPGSWFFVVLLSLSCMGCTSSLPPDLRACTQLAVQYHPSAMSYFLTGKGGDKLLDPLEIAEVRSLDTYVIDDVRRIRAFAEDISVGQYAGRLHGRVIMYLTPVTVVAFRDGKRVASFTDYGGTIVTDDKRRFTYPKGLPYLGTIEPPEIHPLKLRQDCAFNMNLLYGVLYANGPLRAKKAAVYPPSKEWSDVLVERFRARHVVERDTRRRAYSDEAILETFTCPSMQEFDGKGAIGTDHNCPTSAAEFVSRWVSHYAMNPDCEPNSPPDTVLLFETKAGWNQHGGPELFTLDNHGPKGGCVLLNNGTVEFIRTNEELRQLRWK